MKQVSEMDLAEVKRNKEELQLYVYNLEVQLLNVKTKIASLINKENQILSANAPIDVSDHAVLRYLERIKEVDVEAIRSEIVSLFETDIKLHKRAEKEYCCDNVIAVYRDKNIITVYKKISEKKEKIKVEDKKRKKISKRLQKEDE